MGVIASGKFTSIGGQAVLEGVMMRSPHFIAVAVRRGESKRIVIKHDPYSTVLRKFPILAKPILRGVATLVESMIQGMGALSFSAEIGSEDAGFCIWNGDGALCGPSSRAHGIYHFRSFSRNFE